MTNGCLSDLLEEEVRAVSYQSNNKLSQRTHREVGDYVLGENSLCGQQITEFGLQWEITIILSEKSNALDFVDKEMGKMNLLLKVFFEYFIPYEISLITNIVFSIASPRTDK
ncbi:MAG: hypothetical protein R2764_17210 [Bacteroidales bacterium]